MREVRRSPRHRLAQGLAQRLRAIAAEALVHRLQPVDEIDDIAPRIRAARGCAKMRAAAKRAVFVNEAARVISQQRARAIGPFRHPPAPAGAHALGQQQRLASGELWRFAREAEMAAARAALALARGRAAVRFLIDSADLGQRFSEQRVVLSGAAGLTHGVAADRVRPSLATQPHTMTLRNFLLLAAALPALAFAADPAPDKKQPAAPPITAPPMTETQQTATLASGCFWCTEAVFQRIKGVQKVVSGYIGGAVKNPTYEEVCAGTTGHAEAIQVTFDPKTVSFDKLLEVFWASHDPTTLNRQGHDVGTQYRSGVFYHSDEQKKAAEESKKKHQPDFQDPIVTEITKADVFYPAEKYHQNYYNDNAAKNRYCQLVIWPKLKKLGLETKGAEAKGNAE